MEPFRYHIYLCTQVKPEGAASGAASGAEDTLEALRKELASAGLDTEVQVTTCGCLGLCEKGPNLVVYPEGVWYSGVTPDAAREIVNQHLKIGRPVSRLARSDASAMKQEINDHFNRVKALKAYLDQAGMMPEEVTSLMRGFQESRIVLTAIELDIFSAVGEGAAAEQVAQKIQASARATGTLLNALAALKLISKKDNIFYNTPLTSRYLIAGSPDDSRSALMHIVHLWPRWGTLTEAVKRGAPIAHTEMKSRPEDSTRAFIAAMHKNASFRASQVIPAIDLAGVNSVLDLGAGSGAYSIALAKKKPGLKITVFDFPLVIPLTESYLKDAGLKGKISIASGNMLVDDLGQNFDLVMLNAICHMFGPEENLGLFKKIITALNPGGRIAIQDHVLNDDKTSPRQGAIFAINMLVNTSAGGTYSGKEYIDWLTRAGFKEAKVIPLPGPTALVMAQKPS